MVKFFFFSFVFHSRILKLKKNHIFTQLYSFS